MAQRLVCLRTQEYFQGNEFALPILDIKIPLRSLNGTLVLFQGLFVVLGR